MTCGTAADCSAPSQLMFCYFGYCGYNLKIIPKGTNMIQLTRINGTELLVNEQFIEIAEQTPDTVITMQNGHRYLVRESIEEIIGKARSYSRECFRDPVK